MSEASIECLMSVKAEDEVEEASDEEKAKARTHEDEEDWTHGEAWDDVSGASPEYSTIASLSATRLHSQQLGTTQRLIGEIQVRRIWFRSNTTVIYMYQECNNRTDIVSMQGWQSIAAAANKPLAS